MPNIKRSIMWRVAVCFFLVCLFAGWIAVHMFKVQVVEGDKWMSQSDSLSIQHQTIEPARGNIYSDNGSLLATSMPIYEVAFDPTVVHKDTFRKYVSELSNDLSALFPERKASQFKSRFEKAREKGSRYVVIGRRVNYNQLKEMKQFPIFRLGRYKGGLISSLATKRVHPAGQLAFRTVGYYTDDFPGVGIERSYTEDLAGVRGIRLVQKISGGYRPLNEENIVEPVNGRDIHTTINIDFQEIAHMALSRSLIKNNAHHGCAIVMEVATGQIKAIANLENKGEGKMVESYNYAVGESYEPGSVFKVFSTMAALEEGLMKPSDSMNIRNGERIFFKKPMRDSDKGRYKHMKFDQAFALSSNVFFSSLIYDNYAKNPDGYLDYLRKLDLHKKTEIDILGEPEPFLNNPESSKWSQTSLPWLAIGYENLHTPLQILTAYNGILNQGQLMRPYLVERVTDAGLVTRSYKPQVVRKVCSPSTRDTILRFTAKTVQEGTASNIKSDVVSMGGKTGTAQIAGKQGYQFARQYNATFLGHFPAEDPVYSVIVMVNRPSNGVFYATWVSAPVFKEIAEKIYTINVRKKVQKDSVLYPADIQGEGVDLLAITEALNLPAAELNEHGQYDYTPSNGFVKARENQEGTMPDVKGLGLRDALFLLERQGLNVVIRGSGHVKEQFPRKGDEIQIGQKVYISLGV